MGWGGGVGRMCKRLTSPCSSHAAPNQRSQRRDELTGPCSSCEAQDSSSSISSFKKKKKSNSLGNLKRTPSNIISTRGLILTEDKLVI